MAKSKRPTLVTLGLSDITFQKLRRHRIFTLEQLCGLDEGRLSYWKFSRDQIEEIKKRLAKHGLRLIAGG